MPNLHLNELIQELIGLACLTRVTSMMKFDSKQVEIYNGKLIIPIPYGVSIEILNKAKQENKFLHIEIDLKKEKRPRTLSANAYCWVLCQQIAEAMSVNGDFFTKEDVYRQAIKDLFSPVTNLVRNEDVNDMKEAWQSRGIGWICEDAGESTLYGQTRLNFYVGSSQFDVPKMSRLISGLVQDAEALGLDVVPDKEREEMLGKWERDRKKAS